MDGQFWTDFLTNLLNAMIPVLVTVLPVVLTALAGLIVQYIRIQQAKLKALYPTKYEKVEQFAAWGVRIAEQLGVKNLIENKKQYVIDYVQAKCDAENIKIDIGELEDIIEKAVFDEITVKYDAKKLDSTLKE